MNVFQVLPGQALSFLYILTPGIVLLFAAYRAVQKEDAL